MKQKISGFTMLELIVVVAILATLLTLAIPSFKGQMERSRMKGAAELLYSNLQLARSEAIMRNKKINVSLKAGNNWCFGMSDQSTCDCSKTTGTEVCTVDGSLRTLKAEDFPGITMTSNFTAGGSFTFGHVRGMPSKQGTVNFLTSDQHYVGVVLSALGRARVCSNPKDTKPQGIPGYSKDCTVVN